MFWFLFLFILFNPIIIMRGKYLNTTSSCVPNPKGHWIDKGTDCNEQWEWWDPDTDRVLLYVTVIDEDGTYDTVVDDQLHKVGIELVDCNSKREAEIAISLFTAYYTVLGSVTVSDHVRLNLNKDQ